MVMIPAISLSTIPPIPTNKTATPSSPKPLKPNPLNLTLKALSKSFKLEEAVRLIESQPSNPQIDLQTYNDLLHACISTKSVQHGERLYLQLLLSRNGDVRNSFLNEPSLKSKLITLYSVCGRLDEARRVFDDSEELPEQVWVAMAIGYSKNGYPEESLLLYCKMLSRFLKPGNFSFSIALKNCTQLRELRLGRGVHCQIIKSGEEPDQVVYNALLRLYSECGRFGDVVEVFDEMPQRNVVTWNSLISGFVKKGELFEAFDTFRRMQAQGVGFSWVTLTTVLPVCARVTAIYTGKEIHAQIVRASGKPDVLVLNSLMDMYAKCGNVDYSRRIFDGMQCKDLTSWNTLITGYSINRSVEEAIELFHEMLAYGFKPDGVTFIALLSGCSHAGLVEEGQALFERMKSQFGISPTIEHYACLVDILGRGGKIKEALQVVDNMPVKPGGSIWGSLLNSCRLHSNVSLAEHIAKRLFELEPNNPGNYVMLSNIYADATMWEGVNKVRKMMEERGIKKEPGCSWVQVKSQLHTFVAGGGSELRNSEEYKKLWNELMEAMRSDGYVPDTGGVLHDVKEEMKVEWVCGHSERLATMFGLIHTGSRIPIRITKNLRVCVDCHSWMKSVSSVTGRLIILRDTNHFHHFDKGLCSCKDYW